MWDNHVVKVVIWSCRRKMMVNLQGAGCLSSNSVIDLINYTCALIASSEEVYQIHSLT